jgi:hypothetical protein
MRMFQLLMLALLVLALLIPVARADVLYNNDFGGSASGDTYHFRAWAIDSFSVTDSFSLASSSTITGFSLALWIEEPSLLTSLDWSITTAPFGGTTIASATAATPISQYEIAPGLFPGVFDENFIISPISVLTPGTTYWLQIGNATETVGSVIIAWDESDGPSTAYQQARINNGTVAYNLANSAVTGAHCNGSLATCSESFQIFQGSIPPAPTPFLTPEPPVFVLFGIALLSLAGLSVLKSKFCL